MLLIPPRKSFFHLYTAFRAVIPLKAYMAMVERPFWKKAAAIYYQGHLEPLLGSRVPVEDIIDAGLFLFQHIYGDGKETLETKVDS